MTYKRNKAPGQGTVFWVASEGRFRGRIDVPDRLAPGGKRRVTKTGHREHACPFKKHGPDSLQCKAEVEALLQQAKHEAERTGGNGSNGKGVTLAAYLTHWLEARRKDHRRGNIALSTFEQNRQHVELHILPHGISKTALTEVNAKGIEGLFDDLQDKGLSARTVLHIRSTIREALNTAHREGFITRNPAAGRSGAKPPKVHKQVMEFLSPVEVARLVQNAVEAEDDPFAVLWATNVLSGCRIGESLALKVEDLDLDGSRPRLRVRRRVAKVSTSPTRYGLVGGTKSGKERVFDIPQTLADLLIKQAAGRTEGLLFTDEAGALLNPTSYRLQSDWKRALKTAGVRRHLRVHDGRHTTAALLLSAGESLFTVKERLGHSTIAVTADLYGHLTQEAGGRAADALESVLSRV